MVNIFVKEPCRAFADQFTTVQARRHQEGKAMRGEMLHNYTLYPRDGTKRVDKGSAYQVRIYQGVGLYTNLHSWKGTAVAVRRGGRGRAGSEMN